MFLTIIFMLSALLTMFSSFLVAYTRNIMYACIYLLGALIGMAGLYLTLGAELVAATQLLVYVGGVVILMVFAVMLTGGQEFINQKKLAYYLPAVMGNKVTYFWGLLTAVLVGLVGYKLIASSMSAQYSSLKESSDKILPTLEGIGTSLITRHVLAFEVASVLLLVALVGAAVIARPSKTDTE